MGPMAGGRFHVLAVAVLGMVLGSGTPAAGAEEEHPGRAVFVSKGCAVCHEERAVLQAPHVSVLRRGRSLFQLAADMWNHAPLMWANLPEPGLKWPRLTPREMAALALYLNGTAPNDPQPNLERGQVMLVEKGCVRCHTLGGQSERVAKDLVRHVRFDADIAWVAAMWNHAPTMIALGPERRVEYPHFERAELADLIGTLREMGKPR